MDQDIKTRSTNDAGNLFQHVEKHYIQMNMSENREKKTDQMDPNGYSNCENDDQPMDVMFFRTLDRASTVSTSK